MVLGGRLLRSSGDLRLAISRYGPRWKSVQIFWSSQTGFINMVLGGRLLRSSGHLRLAFSIWCSVEVCSDLLVISDWFY